MRNTSSSLRSVTYGTSRASRNGLEKLARFGYATKGVVYGLIGVLALQAALGLGGDIQGSQGVIHDLARQPFAKALLALTAVGLVGYAIWRLVQAVKDPDGAGSGAKGLAQRTGYAVSGLTYLGLAFAAARPLLGMGGGSEGGGQDWTARVMEQPFGRWIVALAGAVVVAVGLYHFYKAYKETFLEHFAVSSMSGEKRQWLRRVGRLGFSARGVTFCLIGVFLVRAAWRFQPEEARGLGGALRTLSEQAYGPWLLGVVAAGFIAYGFFCLFAARYRRIRTR